jgi:hypothetical protein
LCLKIATTVAAIENAARRMATMPVVREKASKPGKERKVTDALNTMAALRRGKVGSLAREKGGWTYHKTGACTDDKCRCRIAKTTFFINPGQSSTFVE